MPEDGPRFLFSPGWPDRYAPNLECTWVVRSPDSTVELNLLSLDVEEFVSCYFDSLVVRDGCGGLLHADRGVVSSPRFPQDYPPGLDCVWHVMVTPGFRISVTFQSPFQVQGFGTQCSSGDYVEPEGNGARLPPARSLGGRLCGSAAPPMVQTSDNDLHVRFVSDACPLTLCCVPAGVGWWWWWSAMSGVACGGHIVLGDNDPPGYITSPNYPQNYPHNIDCVWVIAVPNGEALRDGPTSDSAPIARLCGNTRPSTQHSTGSALFLRFRTDTGVTHKGFKAKYSIATCGGTYIGQSGTIKSPGFPGANYPDGSACEWYLEGPTGHYLTLTFGALNVQSSPDCSKDYVEVREYNASGRLLGKHCGANIPAAMDTGDSFAYVKFVSDASVNAPGFNLSFTASVDVCGGELNAASGTISSPNYPNLYPHSRLCSWQIIVEPGRRVTLTINDLRLEGSGTSCYYDYVEVRNGLAADAPRLNRYCGTVPAGTQVRSSGRTMTVVFRTDASVSNGVCGGVLDNPAGGNFTSPGYLVSNYSSDLNCEWLIQNPQHVNSSIVVLIEDLHLEHHQTCEYDFLQFRLGDYNGEMLVKLCGQTVPSLPIVVFTPELWVHFQTDQLEGDLGFKAKYMFSECGGWQTGEGGVVSSPNYPNNYPGPSRCAWLLQAPEGHTITLTFTYFNLESHTQCRWDSLTIFNGGSPGSPLIGQYCGVSSPGAVQSGSNKLALNFPANSECSWRVVGHEGNHLEMSFSGEFQIPDASGSCQSSYVKVRGRVVSPNYPDHYPGGADCDYVIDAGERTIILLTFTTFQVEAHSTCVYDGLKIYDGTTPTASPLATLCGSTIPGPFSTFGPMLLNFYSDSIIFDNGFLAEYRALACGGFFNSTAGSLSSPGLSQFDYHHNINCSYHVTVRSGRVIDLKFNTFDLESSSNCRYDHVSVYDGGSAAAPLVGKYCGAALPPNLRSATNQLYLVFITDGSNNGVGWRATYGETLGEGPGPRADVGCGGYLSMPTGMLGSPDPDLDCRYEPRMNCLWTIEMPANKLINLTFSSFDVYDGDNMNYPLLGSFCGNTLPMPFLSSGNFLTVRFVTDGVTLTSPFFPGAYPAPTACRWTLDAPAQEAVKVSVGSWALQQDQSCATNYMEMSDWPVVPDFYSYGRTMRVQFRSDAFMPGNGVSLTYQSPGWPDVYPHNMDCTVVLMAPQGSSISLFFNSFDLESHIYCPYDYLEVRNGSTARSPLLGTYCGTALPNPVFPGGNALYLRFKSDFNGPRDGYEATWTSSPQGCGGTLYGDHGSVASPNYPGTYPNGTHCEWGIRAPWGRVVTVTFAQIGIDDPGDCLNNFLKLYDGPDNTTAPVGPYCGLETNIAPFTASSHLVYIVFQGQAAALPSGFRLTWSS
ncbi:hypothetical protein CRUP_025761 [Coryphaenoides rupestris]|nr:hypothetical protein CRUP_025761 [Coryphaenoides rupestris]